MIGSVGVALVAYPAVSEPSLAGPAAALFPLSAALALAGSAVILKRMEPGDALAPLIGWQLMLGAVPLLGLSEWLEEGVSIAWTPTFTALLGFLAAVGTAAATWVWYWLVQREDVGRLGVFMFAVPLIGLVLAWGLFKEPVSSLTIAGALLTIGALIRVAWPERRPRWEEV